MVSPKRRSQLRISRRGREARKKLRSLPYAERAEVEKLYHKEHDLPYAWPMGRSLDDVNDSQGTDLSRVVLSLSRELGQSRIHVLDEGCGCSSFHEALAKKVEELSGSRVKAKVTRTDVDRNRDHTDPHFGPPAKRFARPVIRSPEQLVEKFGRESFHLVVSTFGGVMYTPVNRKRAIANIVEVLKPGGEAFITYMARRKPTLEQNKAEALSVLKHYGNSTLSNIEVIDSEEWKKKIDAVIICLRIKKRK
ncbi:MAG: class I SAM-dependent methyltransferase [Candidatus Diapherotrites archaeon]|nr:class I SAM-dependent methyltransferase [Candidatus Diapherotrites archaeon]